jgi:hypothetical protein
VKGLLSCSLKTMKSLKNSKNQKNLRTRSTKSSMKKTITKKRPTKYLRLHNFNKLRCRQGILEEELTSFAMTRLLLQ